VIHLSLVMFIIQETLNFVKYYNFKMSILHLNQTTVIMVSNHTHKK